MIIIVPLVTLLILAITFVWHIAARKTKRTRELVKKQNRSQARVEIASEADTPVPFGYKIAWLAIRTTDLASVASRLIEDARTSNWKTGMDRAYDDLVFVTPPIGDWILVVSFCLLDLFDDNEHADWHQHLMTLSDEYGELQYFASHRIVGYHGWAKFVKGKEVRAYAYSGEVGETLADRGAKTIEELSLGYNYFDERSSEATSDDYWERSDLCYPDEGHVLQLAAKWSLDPSSIDSLDLQMSTGLAGKLRNCFK